MSDWPITVIIVILTARIKRKKMHELSGHDNNQVFISFTYYNDHREIDGRKWAS